MKSPWLQTEVDPNAKPSFGGATTVKTIYKGFERSFSAPIVVLKLLASFTAQGPYGCHGNQKTMNTKTESSLIVCFGSFSPTLFPALQRIIKFELLHGVVAMKARFFTHVSGAQHMFLAHFLGVDNACLLFISSYEIVK